MNHPIAAVRLSHRPHSGNACPPARRSGTKAADRGWMCAGTTAKGRCYEAAVGLGSVGLDSLVAGSRAKAAARPEGSFTGLQQLDRRLARHRHSGREPERKAEGLLDRDLNLD